MQRIVKQHAGRIAAVLFLGILLGSGDTVSAEGQIGALPNPPTTYRNYSSLAELVGFVSEDTIRQLQNFFYPSAVTVKPFMVLSEFPRNQVTILGKTMADQVGAMVNNAYAFKGPQETDVNQTVTGMLQELDGMLRVHITASNAAGDKESHVVNVEMSEPVYRALHTYVVGY